MSVIILIIIASLMFILWFCGILYIYFDLFGWFYHDILEWHKPDNSLYLGGINLKSKCKYCNKEIIQDSQGNWFAISG